MIHLRVLGGLGLQDADGRELRSVPVQSKRLALLVYLALATPRGFHRRDKLLALFWPELDSAHARNALSQALHALRGRLGAGVLVNQGEQEVGLAPGALACDALGFEDALAQQRPVDALELYRGDLLEGFYLGDAPPEFERWLEEERARLKDMAVTASLAAAEAEEARGNLPLALHWFRRALALAPYDESVMGRKLAVLHRMGNRAGVLRAYERFQRRLREDLGLEASAELEAYVTATRCAGQSHPGGAAAPGGAPVDDAPPQTTPSRTSPAPPRRTRSPMAGRIMVAGVAAILVAVGATLDTRSSGRAGDESGGATALSGSAPPPDAPAERSIAVLPFVNLSPGADQEYFSDGLAEELLNTLSRVPGLRVASRTSSFAIKGKSLPVDTIARRLRVAHLLEGSVRRTGSRLRVTVRLVRADSGYDLWSETYEREATDVLAVQEDISRRVVMALQGTLRAAETAALPERPTDDVAAYELYLKGRYFWNQRTGEALDRAIEDFRAAAARDPAYAEAYAGLADTYNLQAAMGFAPGTEVYPRARAAARRALALDSTLAEAHAALGFVLLLHDAEHAAAERAFRRAIELNPSYAPAHQWYSQTIVLSGGGRFEEARREIQLARELDPLSLAIRTDWARDAYFAREYGLAVERLQGALEINPGYARTHSYLALVYTQQHRYDEAIAEFRKALELSGGWWPSRFGQAGLAGTLALSGRKAEAVRILEELERSERYVSPEAQAFVHAALGDHDAALDALERAWAERAINLGWLAFDPAWDPLRAEPRFARLLAAAKMNPQIPPPSSWVAE